MNSLKKKILLILTLVLSVLFGSVAGVLFNNYKNKIYATEAVVPTVSKIQLYMRDNNNKYYAIFKEGDVLKEEEIDIDNMSNKNDLFNNIKENQSNGMFIQNDDKEDPTNNIFMLKNANLESIYVENIDISGIPQSKTYKVKEFILVQFQPKYDSASIMSLSINVKLNDAINISPLDKTVAQQATGYCQVFDLDNIYKLDTTQSNGLGDKINEYDAQGEYKFTFTYNLRDNGVVTTNNQRQISFYVLDENFYINPNNDDNPANPRDNISGNINNQIVHNHYAKTADTEIIEGKNYYELDNNNYILVDSPTAENLQNYYEQNKLITYNHIYDQNLNTNSQFTEPRLFNTERIDKCFYDGTFNEPNNTIPSEKNYFYFSNQNTTDYDGNLTEQREANYLQYPTIKYDASRYNLSYTKTMYGITTFVTTALDKSSNKLIIYYENASQYWQEEKEVNKSKVYFKTLDKEFILSKTYYELNESEEYFKTNDSDFNDEKTYYELQYQYIATIEFNQIGKYIISFNFVLNDSIINYDLSKKLFIDKENWDLIHSYELSIFGYQLMHSVYKSANGETEKEMKYVYYENGKQKSIYADITNLNFDKTYLYCSTDDIINLAYNECPVNTFETIAKTNQAPLFFRYYATLDSNSSKCYYYQKSNNVYLYTNQLDLTSNTRFTNNGLYVLMLNFTYNDYEYLDNFECKNGKSEPLKQLFIFEIENIEPNIEFYEDEYNKIEPIKYIEVKNIDDLFDIIDTQTVNFNKDSTYEKYQYYFDKTSDDAYDAEKTYYKWNIENLYYFDGNGYVAVEDGDSYDTFTTYYLLKKQAFNAKNCYEYENGQYVLTNDTEYGGIKTYYEKSLLKTGGYTNKNVEVNWQDALASPFDVKPNITVFAQSFDANAKAYPITDRFNANDLLNGKIKLYNTNIYTIKVEYGPCTYAYSAQYGYRYIYSASVTYTFIIDKEVIGEGENVIKFYRNGFNEISKITNKNFALIYGTINESQTDSNKIVTTGAKRSGAKINVSYTYLPFGDLQNNKIDEDLINSLIIPNGIAIENKNENITYTSTEVKNTFDKNSNILTSDGIYIFNFVDAAGNTATKYMIKDSTSPLLVQKLNNTYSYIPSTSSNTDNMVNIDTEVIWGNNKAIKISLDGLTNYQIAKQLFANDYQFFIKSSKKYYVIKSNSFVEIDFKTMMPDINEVYEYNEMTNEYEITNDEYFEGEYYFLVNISSKKINNANADNEFVNIPDKGVTIYYISNGNYYAPNNVYNQNPDYSYLIKATDEYGNYLNDEKTGNEHLFKIRLYDSLGNSFEGLVEMTFDKSQLKAEVSGMPEKNNQIINDSSHFETSGSGISTRLNPEEISNKKTIAFSWISSGEDFSVKKVDCEFYPLTFEIMDSNGILNTNYPYSANYSNKFNLMINTTKEIDTSTMNGEIVETERTKTGLINLVQDSRYGEQASVPGMYKITRIYENDESKDYIFYIDRNNIISYDENMPNNYIGQGIKLIFGDALDSYTFAGSDFLQDFVQDYVLLTNRQPGNINVQTLKQKQVKYYFESDEQINYTYTDEQEIEHTFQGNIVEALALYSKINVNRLYLITKRNNIDEKLDFEDNYLIDHSEDVTTYQFTIYDNSQNADKYLQSNLIKFEVAVNLSSAKADFVDKDTSLVLHEDTNNYISKNNTNVSLDWTVDETGVNAKINETKIVITQTFENGRKVVLYSPENTANITNLVSVDGNKRSIDFNKFYNKIYGVNCRVEITLRYLTMSDAYYGNYLTTTKIIMFDFEKPQLNFTNLLNNDKYLQKTETTKSQFENYEENVNFDNYAFVVDNSYSLSLPQASSFWQKGIVGATTNPNDVQSVWYRKYNKYFDESGINQQSIVPGDDRYDDSALAPTRLRFNPNLYITQNGNSVLAYTAITTALNNFKFENSGYYEIIEKDCAGNYRVYTLHVLPNENVEKETINYEETIGSGETQTTNETFFEINGLTKYEINNQKINIIDIKNLGNWFVIELSNANTSLLAESLQVAPIEIEGYTTLQNALNQINELMVDEEQTGKLFVIKITSSKYLDLTIEYRTPGQKYELDTNLKTTSLTLTIDPNKYESTYLKELLIYEVNEKGEKSETPLEYDSNNQYIEKVYTTDDEVKVYVFTYSSQKVRNLWFEYKDNFGVEYKENIILGITQTPFDEMIVFNGNHLKNDNYLPLSIENSVDFDKYAEYYSSSQTLFEYQPIIYSNVKIYMFDEENNLVDITDNYTPTSIPNKNIERIAVFNSALENDMKDARYIITFEDTSGKKYQFSLHHYTKIADLHFIDSSNFEHCFDIENQELYEFSVSRVVYLEYEKYDIESSYNVQTIVTAKRIYTDSNNVTLTKDYGIIDNEFVFNEYGKYIITATNELGSSKVYEFELIKSDAIYYSVKANANGRTILLSPSEVKYQYNNQNIAHYVSIYDVTVDANQEKSLKVEEITKNQLVSTRIFKIYSTNENLQYEKYIAVSKVAVSSNILDDLGKIIETKMVDNQEQDIETYMMGKYLKTNAKKVVLSLPSCFANEANILRLRVVYEDKDLGFVANHENNDRIELKLSVAGQYKIYVYDLAGNQQSFGGTPYFELSLINNFVYKLNGEIGIYNSIYNSAVSLTIEKQSNFLSNSSGNVFTISCTNNGETFNPTYSNGVYLFDSYGTYHITLKGYLNKDTSGNLIDEVITQIKFTILNANEARLMHEYIGLNGYEVTKIVKNNTDITDLIKESLGTSTINKFAISGLKDAIGGSGVYEITVTAILDEIVGERQFTYSVWINNDKDLLIIPSIPEGSSTTKNITLQANLYQIYSKIGECELKINGNVVATISEASALSNTITTFTIATDNRHVVTLETMSGNTIMSFVVTKIEPLNSIAIIVIVITSLVATALTITFILFRKRMRVR